MGNSATLTLEQRRYIERETAHMIPRCGQCARCMKMFDDDIPTELVDDVVVKMIVWDVSRARERAAKIVALMRDSIAWCDDPEWPKYVNPKWEASRSCEDAHGCPSFEWDGGVPNEDRFNYKYEG